MIPAESKLVWVEKGPDHRPYFVAQGCHGFSFTAYPEDDGFELFVTCPSGWELSPMYRISEEGYKAEAQELHDGILAATEAAISAYDKKVEKALNFVGDQAFQQGVDSVPPTPKD